MKNEKYWDKIFNEIQKALKITNSPVPAVSIISYENNNPFFVLISTIISLRTKDNVTLNSSRKLLEKFPTPLLMNQASVQEIEQLIYPAGFYKTKAKHIKQIAQILLSEYDSKVPNDAESLMKLPGVGIKTANLTLNLGFQIDAICVDCHVHQISNRLGWINTSTPEESVNELEKIMPKRFWIPLNELLVTFGQNICTSVSPHCSICPLNKTCPKIEVKTSR